MSRLPVEREQGDAKRVVFLLVSITYFVSGRRTGRLLRFWGDILIRRIRRYSLITRFVTRMWAGSAIRWTC